MFFGGDRGDCETQDPFAAARAARTTPTLCRKASPGRVEPRFKSAARGVR